jgi:hypothetical protein
MQIVDLQQQIILPLKLRGGACHNSVIKVLRQHLIQSSRQLHEHL